MDWSVADVLRATAAVVLMAAVLILLSLVNGELDFTEVSPGVNWMYLPAGLRLAYVLVVPIRGAIAVFLGSFIMALTEPGYHWAWAAATAAAASVAPLLARVVALHHVQLDPNLSNLHTGMVVKLCCLFGLFATALHQALYAVQGRESAFWAMWAGDVIGALVCVLAVRWGVGRVLKAAS